MVPLRFPNSLAGVFGNRMVRVMLALEPSFMLPVVMFLVNHKTRCEVE